MKYLDPKNDLTFKKVFGEHKHLCKSLLNALLPLSESEQIVDLEYLPAELVPEIPIVKNTIVDVRCVDANGRQFIVEMQMYWTPSFMQRVLFNASKAYVKQLDKKQEYNLLQPVYALSLVDDIFDDSSDAYYHHYKIGNTEDAGQNMEGLEFVFVELPKFKPNSITEKKITALWLRYLTEINDDTTNIPFEFSEHEEITEAIECIRESAFSKRELDYYDKYWDQVRVERTIMVDAEKKGVEIGLVQGEIIGIKKGEALAIGKIVRSLKNNDTPLDQIIRITGLSKEEISELLQ
ncbi:MAG: Rpn family recombination-promoting nuclease/putative transposase [Bacteroidetes bacterium]|nr:Rpn family recombination-promoting nuclease/putative transposase [Bacteroidota bacterium]MBU1720392.1 Rpn family recombination-promoting nuclease/putative transposase [Bacteroidota bacterium]